ncbi:MAG: uroporphyrinogen decarboxylase family protein [Christensenellales bacterium]|jgi:hypothetical protein
MHTDFSRHNEEVRRVTEAFHAGRPLRPLFQPAGSITNFFQNRALNTERLTFEGFFTDPTVQIRAQLAYQNWRRHNLFCDMEMGMPEKWTLGLDFQNSYEASWIGAEIVYNGEYLPDTRYMLREHKEALYDMPKIVPAVNGVIKTGMEFLEFMEDWCKEHTFCDRPVEPPRSFVGEGTDGVLNLAYKLRGAEELLVDMLEDEAYYRDLMEWLTNNIIHRIGTLRDMHEKHWGVRPKGFYYADDAMCLISHPMYREYVLPYQRRIIDAFRDGGKVGMHLCGSNMHHFGGLVKELPINALDTGFPVDFDRLRELVGRDVLISGGPPVMLVKDGTREDVRRETKRVLESKSARQGRFILIAANNMAPCTPPENIVAMYDTLRTMHWEEGYYEK